MLNSDLLGNLAPGAIRLRNGTSNFQSFPKEKDKRIEGKDKCLITASLLKPAP